MKTIYYNEKTLSSGVMFDDETKEVEVLDNRREAINCVKILPEDVKIEYKDHDGNITTLYGKAGNILITFYESSFPNRMIVVDSKEWYDNIITYEKKQEEWRNKAKVTKCCDDCCADCEPERL